MGLITISGSRMLAPVPDGQLYRARFTPPISPYTGIYLSSILIKQPSPVSNDMSFSVYCNPVIAVHVSHLSRSRGPLNIARFIMPVIIDAINRVLDRGAWPDFCKKLCKITKQKFNASPTITMIIMKFRIDAAIFSVVICAVFRRVPHAMIRTVQAPATFSLFAQQLTPLYISPSAACTSYKPINRFIRFAKQAKYGQLTKDLSCEITKVVSGRDERSVTRGKFENSHFAKVTPFVYLVRAVSVLKSLVRPVPILPYKFLLCDQQYWGAVCH